MDSSEVKLVFENKKTILFITKKKIKIASVTLGGKPKEEIIASLDWTPQSLAGILLDHKKHIKEPVRILLDEDFVYTVSLPLLSSSFSRDQIKEKAQELIPESLDETVWDFSEVRGTTRIQVAAVAKVLFGFVRETLAKAGIHIEAVEPLSVALARFSRGKEKPILYVYINDGEILLTLAQNGIAVETEALTAIESSKINQFIEFGKERSGIEPKNIIFCGNTRGINIAQYEKDLGGDDTKVEIQDISPLVSLAEKTDIKGKDEEVLNLELLKLPIIHLRGVVSRHLEGGEATTSTPSRWIVRWKGIIILIFIIIITAIAVGFLLFQLQSKPDQNIIKPIQNGS